MRVAAVSSKLVMMLGKTTLQRMICTLLECAVNALSLIDSSDGVYSQDMNNGLNGSDAEYGIYGYYKSLTSTPQNVPFYSNIFVSMSSKIFLGVSIGAAHGLCCVLVHRQTVAFIQISRPILVITAECTCALMLSILGRFEGVHI